MDTNRSDLVVNPFDLMRHAVDVAVGDFKGAIPNPPTPPPPPPPPPRVVVGVRVDANPVETGLASALKAPEGWPAPMASAAFHGPAGGLVAMLEKHTEADEAGILVQLLVGLGNLMGRTVHRLVECRPHYPLLNCCLVGESARARKGTSWGQVQARLNALDPSWAGPTNGLTSGEGLIAAVCDAPEDEGGLGIMASPVRDKRLLVVEEEFSRVLKGSQREGSTLSDILRAAFDTGSLRVMTRTRPLEATGAHISVIGHITRFELEQVLTRVDCANGFANRFLWVCVRRARFLPEGGQAHTLNFRHWETYVRSALELAKESPSMDFDPAARELWAEYYGRLGREGLTGVAGQVTARAEALLLRLSLIYAALDQQKVISRGNLESAWAVWKYCEASALLLFNAGVDESVERLEAELKCRPLGMSRTDISQFFHHNRGKREIERLLGQLLETARARSVQTTTPTGRLEERWVAM